MSFLVPKLLLGYALGSQALPGLGNFTHRGCTLGAKQSFAGNWVPKRELGNQKQAVPFPTHAKT